MIKRHSIFVLVLFGFGVFFKGCETTPAQSGALGGAAVGAVAGQLIGGDTESTLIGAGAGALGGALFNDYRVKEKNKTYEQGYRDGAVRSTPPPPPYNTSPR